VGRVVQRVPVLAGGRVRRGGRRDAGHPRMLPDGTRARSPSRPHRGRATWPRWRSDGEDEGEAGHQRGAGGAGGHERAHGLSLAGHLGQGAEGHGGHHAAGGRGGGGQQAGGGGAGHGGERPEGLGDRGRGDQRRGRQGGAGVSGEERQLLGDVVQRQRRDRRRRGGEPA